MIRSYIKLNHFCKEIVRLHAHLCGDGYLYEKLEKRSPSNKRITKKEDRFTRYVIEYSNKNQELLNEVKKLITKIVPHSYVCMGKTFLRARNKALFDYMKSLGCGKTLEWSVPNEIIIDPIYRRLWLRAIFDDEGYIGKDSIEVYTTNKKGKDQIVEMLNLENIRTTIRIRLSSENHPNPLYRIRICTYDCFKFEKIGFCHSAKKIKLKEFLKERMRRRGFEFRKPNAVLRLSPINGSLCVSKDSANL